MTQSHQKEHPFFKQVPRGGGVLVMLAAWCHGVLARTCGLQDRQCAFCFSCLELPQLLLTLKSTPAAPRSSESTSPGALVQIPFLVKVTLFRFCTCPPYSPFLTPSRRCGQTFCPLVLLSTPPQSLPGPSMMHRTHTHLYTPGP